MSGSNFSSFSRRGGSASHDARPDACRRDVRSDARHRNDDRPGAWRQVARSDAWQQDARPDAWSQNARQDASGWDDDDDRYDDRYWADYDYSDAQRWGDDGYDGYDSRPWDDNPQPQTPVFLRFTGNKEGAFLTGMYEQPTTSFKASTYKTPTAALSKDPNLWVIGVTYKDINTGVIADTQRSVTGRFEFVPMHCKWTWETPREAALRELQEEVGLTCDVGAFQNHVHTDSYSQEWHTVSINVDSLRPLESKSASLLREDRPDAKRANLPKIQVYVYGTYEQLISKLREVRQRIYIKAETNIAGVSLLPCPSVRSLFSM